MELTWEDMCILHRWSLKRCRAMFRADERDYKLMLRRVKGRPLRERLNAAWRADPVPVAY